MSGPSRADLQARISGLEETIDDLRSRLVIAHALGDILRDRLARARRREIRAMRSWWRP